jgi:hypothetical protein
MQKAIAHLSTFGCSNIRANTLQPKELNFADLSADRQALKKQYYLCLRFTT